MMSGDGGFPAQPVSVTRGSIPGAHRACEECKRKKSKCDMRRPICSSCIKTQSSCVFPTKRKKPVRKKGVEKGLPDNEKEIERILQSLDPDTLQRLLPRQISQPSNGNETRQDSSPRSGVSNTSQQEDLVEPLAAVQPTSNDLEFTQSTLVDEGAMMIGDDGAPLSNLVYDATFPDIWHYQDRGPLGGFVIDSLPEIIDLQMNGSPGQLFHTPSDIIISGYPENSAQAAVARTSPGHDAADQRSVDLTNESNSYAMKVSASVVEHLIELYFSKIQGIIPIFHKKRFYARYVDHSVAPDQRYSHLSLETALLFNSMFALSARFSKAETWKVDPRLRGDSFALEARNLYEEARRRRELDSPTLEYLQGVLLHTYYLFATRPCTRAWVMAGVCSRLAYDQGLHSIDKDILCGGSQSDLQIDEWSQREERRRLWWSIWEVDTFASTISCRPFNIDQNRMHVLLPVSDEAWFSNTKVSSAPLGADPTTIWRSLKSCDNQDERAWFIVSKALLRLSHEASQSTTSSPIRNQAVETAISCFELNLPIKYHLSTGSLLFDPENYSKGNWIAYTVLSVQCARIHLECLKSADNGLQLRASTVEPGSGTFKSSCLNRCRRFVHNALIAIQSVSPEYLGLACPFIACAMVSPFAVNLLARPTDQLPIDLAAQSLTTDAMNLAVIKLSLGHIERYWGLGALITDFIRTFVDQSPDLANLGPKEKELASAFGNIMPLSTTEGV